MSMTDTGAIKGVKFYKNHAIIGQHSMAKDKAEKEVNTSKTSASYGAKDITILEGLDPVRKRPGMYIGSTGVDGLHHLIWEIVDNSIDEAMAGHAKHIVVELLEDNKVAVTDDGRGIPVEVHPQTKKSTLETVLTTLHAGGKFGGAGYKVSGGLHGVGASVVNALSTFLRAEVSTGGNLYAQEFVRGVPKATIKKIGSSKANGTKIIFQADETIFQTIEYNEKRIIDRLRQQAYLTRGTRMTFIDRRKEAPTFHGFYFEGGLRSFVKHLAQGEKHLQDEIFHLHRDDGKMEIEVAFLYIDDIETKELSFANNINTPDGGMHLTGFRSALTRSINNYARTEGYLKEKDENLTAEDMREGMVAVVLARLPEPQFEGQTKNRLGNPEARTITENVVNEGLKEFLEKHPQEARRIVEKVMLAAKARLAAKAAKDTILRKGALDGLTLPGKLADCSSKNAEESEIFIVEGDSAGGCFSGETKVALADGRNIAFTELIEEEKQGKQNYAYTIQGNGKISIAPIKNVRITRQNTRVIKVVLDSGEEITCTPDHKFMLRDGTYLEAQNLKTGVSLMPLYRKYSEVSGAITIEGYEMVLDPVEFRWVFTHMLTDRYNLAQKIYRMEDGEHRHHKDYNKRNNNPDNLVRLSKEQHLQIHRDHAGKTLHRPETMEKARRAHQTEEYRARMSVLMSAPKMAAQLSIRAKKQWEDTEYKEYMKEKFFNFYSTNAEYREQNKEQLNLAQQEYWEVEENRSKQSVRVKGYFEEHPEKREALSVKSGQQWADPDLRNLRAEMTKEQWTPEFREKRKATYNETYLRKALDVMSILYEFNGSIDPDIYDAVRTAKNDKSLIRFDTIVNRFFAGDVSRLKQAVAGYNHKVAAVISVQEKMDVYDLEIPETHNFALASGVFVHNSAKAGRDRRTQAILPVKGKILNVEKSRIDKMLANQEIRSLVIALGTAISDSFDLSKLRYHKIVLMSDADVDGAHIRTLFLTLFFRYFRPIVDGGFLYIAQPPLYRVQSGKDVRYAFDDAEKDIVVKEMLKAKADKAAKKKGKDAEAVTEEAGEEVTAEKDAIEAEAGGSEGGEKVSGISIQRYKGLGEMNPDQLWETTMNPENRILKQVEVNDADEASRLFDVLMGDQVEPRKQFIQLHAASVENLDI